MGGGEKRGRKVEARENTHTTSFSTSSENGLSYYSCISTEQVYSHTHTHTHHHSGQLPPGGVQTIETHKYM